MNDKKEIIRSRRAKISFSQFQRLQTLHFRFRTSKRRRPKDPLHKLTYHQTTTVDKEPFYSSFFIRNNPVNANRRPRRKAESVAVPVLGKVADLVAGP